MEGRCGSGPLETELPVEQVMALIVENMGQSFHDLGAFVVPVADHKHVLDAPLDPPSGLKSLTPLGVA